MIICYFIAAASTSAGQTGSGRSKHMGSEGLRLIEDDLHQIIGSPPHHDAPRDLIGPGQPVDLDLLVQEHMGMLLSGIHANSSVHEQIKYKTRGKILLACGFGHDIGPSCVLPDTG